DVKTLFPSLVAAVEDETVRLDYRRRANVFAVCPVARATCGAASTQNTFGRVVKAFALFNRLQAFARLAFGIDRDRIIVHEIRQDSSVMREERLEIYDQVFDDLQPDDRLNLDRVV